MAALFDLPSDVVLCGKTVLVIFGVEGFDKDNIAVAVVSKHKIEVTTARTDGKAPHIIYVDFSNRFHPNIQLFVREERIWSGRLVGGFKI